MTNTTEASPPGPANAPAAVCDDLTHMVLLYHGHMDDPRIGQLDAAAYWVWIAAVSMCNASEADTIRVAELHDRVTEAREAKPEERPNVDECIAAFVRADLARRLPDDRVQMLARLDLWAFDSDDEPDVVIGTD